MFTLYVCDIVAGLMGGMSFFLVLVHSCFFYPLKRLFVALTPADQYTDVGEGKTERKMMIHHHIFKFNFSLYERIYLHTKLWILSLSQLFFYLIILIKCVVISRFEQ